MGQGVSEVLPFAVGVAISPIPIIAVILMLLSNRAAVNGPAFLLGWVAGLSILCLVVYVVADAIGVTGDSSGADGVSWLDIALGALLLAAALRSWRKRPAAGAEPEMPAWLTDVATITPRKALALGVGLSAANPKNAVLTVGAAAGLAQVGVSAADVVVSVVVFVVIASSSVGGAVVYHVVGGDRAKKQLGELR
ncbi:MAG TPA: GAP family protein, partial [Actinomycetota bacterium]|nr:GAP family protein [Actinomycetota bacterium]